MAPASKPGLRVAVQREAGGRDRHGEAPPGRRTTPAQRATEEPRLLRGRTRGIQHPDSGSSSVARCAGTHHLRRLAVAGNPQR